MSSRVAGAGLALIAAALLAAVIATPVVVPANLSLFAGHPTVNGHLRETQDVYVGLYDARLCNSGGDGRCKSGDATPPFRLTALGELGATGLLLISTLVLGGLAVTNSKRRKAVGWVVKGLSVIATGGAIALLVQSPFVEAQIPIGEMGAALYGAGILFALLTGFVAGRPPSAIKLRVPAQLQPTVELTSPPAFSAQSMFNDAPPPGRGDVRGPSDGYRAETAEAGDPFAPPLGVDQPMFSAPPLLRPLYDASPMQGGTGGLIAMDRPQPHDLPTPVPRGPSSETMSVPTVEPPRERASSQLAFLEEARAQLFPDPANAHPYAGQAHAHLFQDPPPAQPSPDQLRPQLFPEQPSPDQLRTQLFQDQLPAQVSADQLRTQLFQELLPDPRSQQFPESTHAQAFAEPSRTQPFAEPSQALPFADTSRAQAFADTSRAQPPAPPPGRSKAPSAPPMASSPGGRTQLSFSPPMPSHDLSASYDPPLPSETPPPVLSEGTPSDGAVGTDVHLWSGGDLPYDLSPSAPVPRARVETPLASPPPPIAPSWPHDAATFAPPFGQNPTPTPTPTPARGAAVPYTSDRETARFAPSPEMEVPVPTSTVAVVPPPVPQRAARDSQPVRGAERDTQPAAKAAVRAAVPMPARPTPSPSRPPVAPSRPPPLRPGIGLPATIRPIPAMAIPAIPAIRPTPPRAETDIQGAERPGTSSVALDLGEHTETNVSIDIPLPDGTPDDAPARAPSAAPPSRAPAPPTRPNAKLPITTAPDSLPPPKDNNEELGPSPACPQCESPMAWVDEHLRFYCKSCRMYF